MNDRPQQVQIAFTRDQVRCFLAALLFSGVLLRLMVAYLTVHYYDLSFYIDWSTGVTRDFFSAYNKIENLDYPPLFLFPLYFTGKLINTETVSGFDPYMMLALKGWQMLFDVLTAPLIYWVLRRRDELWGLLGAALWALCPAMVCNSAYWGQTDAIMIFLLVLAFGLLDGGKPVWAGVVMTLACLMKFQSLYFAPLFGLALLAEFPLKKSLRAIGAGAGTALAVFVPFMAQSGWTLPWDVYFGGFEQYPGASLNAFNLYTAAGLNERHVDTRWLGWLTAGDVSAACMGLALACLLILYFTATEKSVWLLGFLFMQTVFLFTARMHERYQVPVLAFGLIACVYHRSSKLFAGWLGLSGIVFLNEFLVLETVLSHGETTGWVGRFDEIAQTLSWVNLLLFAATAAIALGILYRHGFRNPFRKPRAGQTRL